MSPSTLLDWQLARLIRHRRLGPQHATGLEQGLEALEALADRLAFVRPPFDLANIARTADDFGAELLVLDYIQRIGPPGEHGDELEAAAEKNREGSSVPLRADLAFEPGDWLADRWARFQIAELGRSAAPRGSRSDEAL